MQLTLGEHNTWVTGEKLEKKVRVASIFIHESYNRRTVSNDIAVLELAAHVNLTVFTPACLSKTSDGERTDGLKCQVYGYGRGTEDGILHEIDVTLVDNNKCSETYEDFISGGKVCGKSQNNTGACLVKFYNNCSILITSHIYSSV